MLVSRFTRTTRQLVAAALALGVCPACALTSKAEPLSPRYFSPDLSEPGAPARGSEAPNVRAAALELRLGRVEASSHLEERIAYRPSEGELGYYEDWRWTEPPQAFLRRALAREFFERRGFVHVVSGPAPTLDVELSSFEELRQGTPAARIELRFSLSGERRVLLEQTLRVQEPIAPGTAEDAARRLTRALASALSQAVAKLAAGVATELGRVANQDPSALAPELLKPE